MNWNVMVSSRNRKHVSRSMMIKSNNKNVKERIWIYPVTSEITLQPLEPDTDTPSCKVSVSLQFEKVTQLNQLLAKVERKSTDTEIHEGDAWWFDLCLTVLDVRTPPR